jgi:hypothetical protein
MAKITKKSVKKPAPKAPKEEAFEPVETVNDDEIEEPDGAPDEVQEPDDSGADAPEEPAGSPPSTGSSPAINVNADGSLINRANR